MIVGKPCGVSRTIRRPATSRSSACQRMRWTTSVSRPSPRDAMSSMPNRSSSTLWSPPFSASLRTRNNSSALLVRMACHRQAHGEHRAFARLACHRHVAAHHARELAGDGKPEPRPAVALRGRGIGLAELLKQLGLLFGGHPDAGVGDGELDEAAAIAHLACGKLDLARFGELAAIAQEIEQYLPQPHGVDGQCSEVLLSLRLLSSISRNRRAFWIASTDWAANVCRRSMVPLGKLPGCLRGMTGATRPL